MEKGGGSRLMQMQARFQQKQLQEREMKIANLYEAQQARALDRVRHSPSNGVRHSPSNGVRSNNSSISSPPQAVSHQPGKKPRIVAFWFLIIHHLKCDLQFECSSFSPSNSTNMSNREVCVGCKNTIFGSLLRCCVCCQFYDFDCANVTKNTFTGPMAAEQEATWTCMQCTSKRPSTESNESPVRPPRSGVVADWKRGAPMMRPNILLSDILSRTHKKTEEFSEMQMLMMKEKSVEKKATLLQMETLSSTMSSLVLKIDECHRKVGQLDTRVGHLEARLAGGALAEDITATLLETIHQLKCDIDCDQELMSNALEFSFTPEEREENLLLVRQMFEERRTKGIDKSYPLQPIHNSERTRKALPNGYSKVTATSNSTSRVNEKQTTKTHTITQNSVRKAHHKTDNIVNGSGDLNHNHEPDMNSLRHALPKSNGEPHNTDTDADAEAEAEGRNETSYLLEDETFPDALAPAQTPRSPEPVAPRQEVKPPPRRSPAVRTSPPKTKPQPHAATPPRRVVSENTTVTQTSRAKGVMQKAATSPTPPVRQKQPAVQTPRSPVKSRSSVAAASAGGGGGGEPCVVCGRRFATDRLAKHQEICKKAHAKKRKPFDALKHRLAGTEAEPFIGKLRKGTNQSSTKVNKSLNSSWRKKHEEFIQAIRAAKQVQAHLAGGGKLSDLPPPPPSENPDYVSCPHCGRRFNQGAADRHIPKCKDYQFNKPKPAARKR